MRGSGGGAGEQRERSLLDARLKQNVVFSGLPGPVRDRIAAAARFRSFDRGELIAEELSSPDHLVLLLEGGAQVCRRSDEGQRVVFRVVRPPAALGFLLLSGQPHTAGVLASEPTLAALLPLRGVFAAHPQRLYEVITRLAELVDALSGELMEQRTLPLAERLRVAILRNADERGQLLLSHDELAELVGCTRANATRALKRLADSGQVEVRRRMIRILRG